MGWFSTVVFDRAAGSSMLRRLCAHRLHPLAQVRENWEPKKR